MDLQTFSLFITAVTANEDNREAITRCVAALLCHQSDTTSPPVIPRHIELTFRLTVAERVTMANVPSPIF